MTVEELGARMTAREFIEWQLFDAHEGLSDRRADWRGGMIAAVFANVHRKKGTKPFSPQDFMWKSRPAKTTRKAGAAERVDSLFGYLATRAQQRGESSTS